ncbi:hypothetical protein [Sphingobacterium hotanense]|uniref:hypothetical protein n=1 Tax=Sphingobacterium hotanense TaxID=649196 RepID=UPI0021A867E5|nr:hypothetical protein [Sphingobacterium hotanense]MCT1523856.1 hypothetical protein [Sphingobacterium hotanense]
MKAISKRHHRTLMAALRQLEELQQTGVVPADGFLQYIQSLSERFAHYETLLSQLADCISEYEALHKEVRVNVVAPTLRQARKAAKPNTKQYREITTICRNSEGDIRTREK